MQMLGSARPVAESMQQTAPGAAHAGGSSRAGSCGNALAHSSGVQSCVSQYAWVFPQNSNQYNALHMQVGAFKKKGSTTAVLLLHCIRAHLGVRVCASQKRMHRCSLCPFMDKDSHGKEQRLLLCACLPAMPTNAVRRHNTVSFCCMPYDVLRVGAMGGKAS
eukprot:1159816-Pelagomonas_calceolata.AAC.2